MSATQNDALDTCGCQPREREVPSVFNRPGLSALDYRIATHGSFLRRMLLHIASWTPPEDQAKRPLAQLTTRSTGDPAIALLDAWAMVGDVLSFYQERIANEGFLRTATERRSILELARMIGYELNPGVAASAHLVFEVEGRFVVADRTPLGLGPPPREAIVPHGTKVQSIPGQDELPQTFETRADLRARTEWNLIRPQLTIPQPVSLGSRVLYIDGIATGFVRGDRVLITAARPEVAADEEKPKALVKQPGVDVSILNVLGVAPQVEQGRTRLDLEVLAKFVPQAQPPAPTPVEPVVDDFAPPPPPPVRPVAPAELDPPVFVLVPRPLTAEEIEQRILAYAWTDAQLAAQAAIHWWDPNAMADWIRYTLAGPDLSPVLERVQVVPARDTKRPAVLTVFPALGATNVHPKTIVIVSFSEPMDPASALAAVTLRDGAAGGAVVDVGLQKYDATTGSVSFVPKTNLTDQGKYFVVVADSAKDANGLGLAARYESSFTVADYHGPDPPKATPAAGQPNVPARTDVRAEFAEVVLNVDEHSFFLRDSAGTMVPAKVSLADANKTAVLTPRSPLALSTRYTATLTSAITDNKPNKNRIANLEWTFITAVRPPDAPDPELRVYGFREQAAFFGHNAAKWASLPKQDGQQRGPDPYPESWDDPQRTVWVDSQGSSLGGDAVHLEREVRGLEPKSWAIFETETGAAAFYVGAVSAQSLVDYGLSGRASRLQLSQRDGSSPSQGAPTPPKGSKLKRTFVGPPDFRVRETAAHVRSELLNLVRLPVEEPLSKGTKQIVLDTMVTGLGPDHLVALRGELLELRGAYGDELLVLEQSVHAAGRTTLFLRFALEHSYVRKTVTMNANVVVATHGETVAREILGGGDGSQANQRFTLRRPPLTHISDITPSGAASTLEVRVDDVLWAEAPVLYGLGPRSRRYIVRVDDDGKPSIVFGDGQRGARPPTGTDNIVARYRSGIGNAGMVGAGRLTLLRERPLGIASVTNPLPAGGAAEPENRDAARENAPLTVLTMERIVSLRDFEDFARGFAGIGKAQAIDVWRGAAHEVHVTVAPADGGVLLPTAPLLKNLVKAIDDARDPGVAVTVESFAPRYFELDASVRIAPEYLPEKVLAGVRTALLDAFSFARRSFGQPVTAAEVVEIAQGVPGVVATYLLALTMTTEETAAAGPKAAGHGKGRPRPLKALARPLEQVLFVQRAHLAGDRIVPAELLVINPGALSVTEHAA